MSKYNTEHSSTIYRMYDPIETLLDFLITHSTTGILSEMDRNLVVYAAAKRNNDQATNVLASGIIVDDEVIQCVKPDYQKTIDMIHAAYEEDEKYRAKLKGLSTVATPSFVKLVRPTKCEYNPYKNFLLDRLRNYLAMLMPGNVSRVGSRYYIGNTNIIPKSSIEEPMEFYKNFEWLTEYELDDVSTLLKSAGIPVSVGIEIEDGGVHFEGLTDGIVIFK